MKNKIFSVKESVNIMADEKLFSFRQIGEVKDHKVRLFSNPTNDDLVSREEINFSFEKFDLKNFSITRLLSKFLLITGGLS